MKLSLVLGLSAMVAVKGQQGLSLQQVQSILHSQATQEFHGSHQDAEEIWQNTLEQEWQTARQHEHDRRRLQDENVQWPFIVCDHHYGKTGDQCQSTIQELTMGENLLPIINKKDISCFLTETAPSRLEQLPEGITATPMTTELKLALGIVDQLDTIQRLGVTFCPGEVSSLEQATDLAQDLLSKLFHHGHRQLRAQAFLKTRQLHRHAFWERQLEITTWKCQEWMAEFMSMAVSEESMTFTVSHVIPGCLAAVIVDLAMHKEVCFIHGYQPIQLRNDVSSGIVQSGNRHSRPFHDIGIDGTGQVVAVSDTGLDVDNCYFYDPNHPVAPSKNAEDFNLEARKIVQYFAFADDKEEARGHGSHVVGSLAGQRISENGEEIHGRGDGVAKGAKIAFFDISESE